MDASKIIDEVDPEIVAEWKWMGSPVFNHDGVVCVLNAHSKVVKMTVPKGAQLKDPRKVSNAELGGNARRAIDWPEGSTVDAVGVKGILRDAAALNREKPAARKAGADSSVTAKVSKAKKKPAAK